MATILETRRERRAIDWRVALVAASAVLAAIAVFTRAPIPQDPSYHRFADSRVILGVPNGLNVLSNLAFAVVGGAGLWLLLRGRLALRDSRERFPWLVFFGGVALTSAGSAWYHLAPSNETLIWDRLPMAFAFMGLLAVVVAERIDPRTAVRVLGPLVLAGIGGVLYWYATERSGSGDLRPYALVQFYPALAIPLLLVLFPRPYTLASGFVGALGAYVLAKLAESKDAAILGLGGLVSGHTLKHLLAAAGIGILVWMLVARSRVDGVGSPVREPVSSRGKPGPDRFSSRAVPSLRA